MPTTNAGTGPRSRRHHPSYRTIAACGLGLAVAAAVAVYALGPSPPSWYPPCLVHHVTELHCPGCGSGRAVHALAHGEFARAFGQNACAPVFLAILGAWLTVAGWRGLRHDCAPSPLPSGTARAVLVVLVLFTVARNLPWWPLTTLAPG